MPCKDCEEKPDGGMEVRHMALQLAISSAGSVPVAKSELIVDRAKTFERYLRSGR